MSMPSVIVCIRHFRIIRPIGSVPENRIFQHIQRNLSFFLLFLLLQLKLYILWEKATDYIRSKTTPNTNYKTCCRI